MGLLLNVQELGFDSVMLELGIYETPWNLIGRLGRIRRQPLPKYMRVWYQGHPLDMKVPFLDTNVTNEATVEIRRRKITCDDLHKALFAWANPSKRRIKSTYTGDYLPTRKYALKYWGDIRHWDVSGVTDMQCLFKNQYFNEDISRWDVSNVTNMKSMFAFTASFNQDISGWDVSKVKSMENMFHACPFNQDISGWNTLAVQNMSGMFCCTPSFNQDIGGWNTSSVQYMSSMFSQSAFNQDISGWNTSSVQDI